MKLPPGIDVAKSLMRVFAGNDFRQKIEQFGFQHMFWFKAVVVKAFFEGKCFRLQQGPDRLRGCLQFIV